MAGATRCTCLGDLIEGVDGKPVLVILLPDWECIVESHRLAYQMLEGKRGRKT